MSTQSEGMVKKRNKPALASVAWGVIALLLPLLGRGNTLLEVLALLSSLVALWTARAGVRKAKEPGQKGRNWAISGLIIGGIGLVVAILLLISPS